MNEMNILNYFTPQSRTTDGKVNMLATERESRKALYLTNQHGQKLLKIAIKNEPQKYQGNLCAQLKIITYGIKRVWLWRDSPTDPKIITLHNEVELTYHGGPNGNVTPKAHLKIKTGRYTTLMEDSLCLPLNTQNPVPLFSFETGYANEYNLTNPVTKKAHIVKVGSCEPVRFDIYLAGATFNIKTFFHSMYFFNLFWTPDYLMEVKNHQLSSGLIIAPIIFLTLGEYQLVVRRSLSNHGGRPRLHFYNNKNYYEKFMNRPIATRNSDGTLNWSTMKERDTSLRGK